MRFDPKQWEAGQPYPPLGTLYAAALMRREGFDTKLFDTFFLDTPETVANAMADAKRMLFIDIPRLERTQPNPQKGQSFRLHEKFSRA